MKRFHVRVHVADLDRSIGFCTLEHIPVLREAAAGSAACCAGAAPDAAAARGKPLPVKAASGCG